ncbi:MAG: RNA polymerase sigma factor [Bacteroidales bacterium]|nr:RNA polymerase sigma factor [Bacteroidales bacterium]
MNRVQYNRCVDQYSDGLYRFALASLRNREEAEDVVQDCFARVWEHRGSVDYAKAKSYLFTTAHHLIVDTARKRHQETSVEELFSLPYRSATAYPDVNQILHKVVATLPEAQRSAVLLRDYEGYSYQEIGEITGQSESQVKVNIFRARTALRNMIKSMDNLIDAES